jgi:hypothetical protein
LQPAPEDVRLDHWNEFKRDAIALFEQHGQKLAELGWTTLDLFGLHAALPAIRVSHSGLARFLHGGALVDIATTHAVIQHRTGSRLTFRRTDPRLNTVPAWSLHPQPTGETKMPYEESLLDATAAAPTGRAWLSWHVQPTMDPKIPACSFSLRSGGGREPIDLSAPIGCCFDWPTSVVGWTFTEGLRGEQPRRVWSPTRSKQIPRPAPINGKNWRRNFWTQLCCHIGGEAVRVVWEGSGQEASWRGYADLMIQLAAGAQQQLPKLPLLVFTEPNGMLAPQFKVLRYVDRPVCLPPDPDDIGGDNANNARDPDMIPF